MKRISVVFNFLSFVIFTFLYEETVGAALIKINKKLQRQVPIDEILANEILEEEMVIDEIWQNEILAEEMLADEVLLDELLNSEILADEMLADELTLDEALNMEILADDVLKSELFEDEDDEDDEDIDEEDLEEYQQPDHETEEDEKYSYGLLLEEMEEENNQQELGLFKDLSEDVSWTDEEMAEPEVELLEDVSWTDEEMEESEVELLIDEVERDEISEQKITMVPHEPPDQIKELPLGSSPASTEQQHMTRTLEKHQTAPKEDQEKDPHQEPKEKPSEKVSSNEEISEQKISMTSPNLNHEEIEQHPSQSSPASTQQQHTTRTLEEHPTSKEEDQGKHPHDDSKAKPSQEASTSDEPHSAIIDLNEQQIETSGQITEALASPIIEIEQSSSSEVAATELHLESEALNSSAEVKVADKEDLNTFVLKDPHIATQYTPWSLSEHPAPGVAPRDLTVEKRLPLSERWKNSVSLNDLEITAQYTPWSLPEHPAPGVAPRDLTVGKRQPLSERWKNSVSLNDLEIVAQYTPWSLSEYPAPGVAPRDLTIGKRQPLSERWKNSVSLNDLEIAAQYTPWSLPEHPAPGVAPRDLTIGKRQPLSERWKNSVSLNDLEIAAQYTPWSFSEYPAPGVAPRDLTIGKRQPLSERWKNSVSLNDLEIVAQYTPWSLSEYPAPGVAPRDLTIGKRQPLSERWKNSVSLNDLEIVAQYTPWSFSEYPAPGVAPRDLTIGKRQPLSERWKNSVSLNDLEIVAQYTPWSLSEYPALGVAPQNLEVKPAAKEMPVVQEEIVSAIESTIAEVVDEQPALAAASISLEPEKEMIDPLFSLKRETISDSSESTQATAQSSLQAVNPNHYPVPKYLSEYQLFGQTVGCGTGYTTLEMLMASDYRGWSAFPFIDLRGHYLENDTYAANLGVGGRYFVQRHPLIAGANAFYDYRGSRSHSFHQVGFGVELMGERWTVQVNGYTPLGKKHRALRCHFLYPNNFFEVRRKDEYAFSGFNAFANWQAVRKGKFSMYVSGGPYFLSGGTSSSTWGGQIGLQPQYRDYVSLMFTVSHDPLFGTRFQGGILFSLPLYRYTSLKNQKSPNGLSNKQIYQPVQRIEIIPLEERKSCKKNF